ncbi:hypothetical protein [Lysobacter capsici]|uniref:hypothetical protein n=1 Tax=Lysobacter capsici TaxID=435897 RepID=UPI00287B9F91|nr:hypothetical protein [Lysobacter capsici]WND82014.1 hypothetical protein RJ610_06540 [Lysobacter capsici]WND87210.1 hypothetical protein RJ609_06545 [Lysobacter capsici]
MTSKSVGDLISWLKYFDAEYIEEETFDRLKSLDVNSSVDQIEIIEIAVIPEFIQMNDISKESMKKILRECMNLSDGQLSEIFSRVEIPFLTTVNDRPSFLRVIYSYLFETGKI